MLNELRLPDCEHSRDPMLSCALEGVASVLAGVEGAALVIHSPQGCAATVNQAFDAHEIDFTRRKIACSRLFETDIIMGASEKLRELVLEADRNFGTPWIFVVGTCAADIIGEDMQATCRALEGKVGARLVPIMAGGFRGDAFAGMDLGLDALAGLPLPAGEGPSPAVNLVLPQASLNPTWWADAAWAARALEGLGAGPCAAFPFRSPPSALGSIRSARASVLLSHDAGFRFARELESDGVPWIMRDLPLPIGLENTARWLREAGRLFGGEAVAEEMIERGEAMVAGVLRKRGLMIVPRYRNCRVAISADATLAIPLVRALYLELEMIPEAVLIRGSTPEARAMLDRELAELGISPLVAFDADGWAIREALRSREIDAVLGSAWELYIAEELGIRIAFDVASPTNRDLYLDRAYFGYEGFLNLLEAMGNAWESALRSKRIAWEQFED